MKYITLLLCYLILSSCSSEFDKIPEKILEATDTKLSKNQDIILFGLKPYSGFILENYSSNKKASLSGYVNGKLEGKQEKWYEDGSKMELRYYKENRKTGIHRGWWGNGQKKYKYIIKDDVPIKTHREWFPSGQLYSLSNYNIEGQPEGTQQMWFENGQIKSNYVIKNGRRFGFLGAKGCMGEGEKKARGLNLEK